MFLAETKEKSGGPPRERGEAIQALLMAQHSQEAMLCTLSADSRSTFGQDILDLDQYIDLTLHVLVSGQTISLY